MKILKILLILIAVLFAAYLVASLMGPKDYKVERSKVINANDSIAFEQVCKFNNWDSWSPWKEKDPTSHYSVAGKDGTVGAVYSWSGGDPDVTGTGSMTLTEVAANSKVAYDLVFTEPWEMSSKGGFELESAGENKTKVTWYDEGDIPFGQRAMMLMMDLDQMMGPDFERGLDKMDSLATISQSALAAVSEETE